MHLICILHKISPKGNFHYKETSASVIIWEINFSQEYIWKCLGIFEALSKIQIMSPLSFCKCRKYIWKEDLKKLGREECKFILTLFRMAVKVWSVWLENFPLFASILFGIRLRFKNWIMFWTLPEMLWTLANTKNILILL